MRAVIVEEFGQPEDLKFKDIPSPEPQPDEVVIDVKAVGVNFVDLLVIGGRYQFLPERPFTPGKLPVGVVCKLGRNVTSLALGDRVVTMAEHGGYAEQVAVRAADCFRLSDSMPFVDAASMALGFDTAWFALHERGRLRKGEVVLVLGATGAVGLAAIQFAKAAGAKVLAGVSSLAKSAKVIAAGADEVVDLSAPDLQNALRARVLELTKGHGADVVIDLLGDRYFAAAIRAMAWCGRLVVVGFAGGEIPTLKINYVLLKNIEISGLQISDYRKRRPEMFDDYFSMLFSLYESGQIKPAETLVLPLEGAAEGLRMLRDRTTDKRIVLAPRAS